MPKPYNETYQHWKSRLLDPISPTVCGAKWYNATIWLGSGQTASCHHPSPHVIPIAEIGRSYRALHNTEHKKAARADMLAGVQTPECEYCWRTENKDPNLVSDRTFKSVIYSDADLAALETLGAEADVELKTLEIAFDNLCNFACSYCSSNYSTTWAADIAKNGPYIGMTTQGHQVFQNTGEESQRGNIRIADSKSVSNVYVDAFWQWWDNGLSDNLVELRITGGEALMSPSFWRLLEWYRANPGKGPRLALNSNMGGAPHLIDKLIEATHSIDNFELYTSCESTGAQAEYIRDGLKWTTWLRNIEELVSKGNVKHTHCMLTLSALATMGVVELMDKLVALREKHNNKYFLQTSFNLLRFPGFQSIFTLTPEFRSTLADETERWLNNATTKQTNEFERASIRRYIEQLRFDPPPGHDLEANQEDLIAFLTQYDKRRGKDWRRTFPRLVSDLL